MLREERESGQNSEGEGGENGTYLVRPGQRRAWRRGLAGVGRRRTLNPEAQHWPRDILCSRETVAVGKSGSKSGAAARQPDVRQPASERAGISDFV